MRLSTLVRPATLLAIIYGSSQPALASSVNSSTDGTITLPPEISSLIPACARNCFAEVIEFDFPFTQCSFQPDLDCLCSKAATTSDMRDPNGIMTAGAAARDCIGTCAINDTSLACAPGNICKGDDTTEEVRNVAFNMCNGRPEPGLLSEHNTTSTSTTTTSNTSNSPQTIFTILSTTVSISTAVNSPERSSLTSPSSLSDPAHISTGVKVGAALGSSTIFVLGIIILVLYRQQRHRNRVIEVGTENRTSMSTREFKSELDSSAQILELENRKSAFGQGLVPELEGESWKIVQDDVKMRDYRRSNVEVFELDGMNIGT